MHSFRFPWAILIRPGVHYRSFTPEFLAPALACHSHAPAPRSSRSLPKYQARTASAVSPTSASRTSATYPVSAANSAAASPAWDASSSSLRHTTSGSLHDASKPLKRPSTNPQRDLPGWILQLDHFLPLELRSSSWLENLASFQGISSVEALPSLLKDCETATGCDLLEYVALQQDRWPAVLRLIDSILTADRRPHVDPDQHLLEPYKFSDSRDLWALSEGELLLEKRNDQGRSQSPSLREIVDKTCSKPGNGLTSVDFHFLLGRIWKLVGISLVQIVSRPRDDNSLSHVHQIIAWMHHHNLISSGLYDNDTNDTPSLYRKSPLLGELRSRILTILSDAMWKAEERKFLDEAESMGAQYVYKGRELPGAEWQPRIQQLRPELWLELVLWSCLKNDWIAEAANILAKVGETPSKPYREEQSWNVVSWDRLNLLNTSNSGESIWSLLDLYRQPPFFGGPDSDPPMLDMGIRTISSEAVANIFDALISWSALKTHTIPADQVSRAIKVCLSLLGPGLGGSALPLWTSSALQLVERADINLATESDLLQRLLEKGLDSLVTFTTHAVEDSRLHDSYRNHVVLIFHLKCSFLQSQIQSKDSIGALRAFLAVQDHIDSYHDFVLQSFIRRPLEELEERFSFHTQDQTIELAISPQTLADFLQLITKEGLFDLGQWLIRSRGMEQPKISLPPPPMLLPALFDFASAAKDHQLIKHLANSMHDGSEHSDLTWRALLRSQIHLGQWFRADMILKHLRHNRRLSPDVEDIALIAQKLLFMENTAPRSEVRRGAEILRNVLRGAYSPKPNPYELPNYEALRERNQMSRLLASASGTLRRLAQPLVSYHGQANTSFPIRPEAFNSILEGVIHARGTDAGVRFFERWCKVKVWELENCEPRLRYLHRDSSDSLENAVASFITVRTAGIAKGSMTNPSLSTRSENQTAADLTSTAMLRELVVQPDFRTIDLILAPFLASLHERLISQHEKALERQTEHSVVLEPNEPPEQGQSSESSLPSIFEVAEPGQRPLLRWGARMYLTLGMRWEDVEQKISGVFEGLED